MLTLKNDYLTVKINPLGAELTSVVDNETQLEYMWQADKATGDGMRRSCFQLWAVYKTINTD